MGRSVYFDKAGFLPQQYEALVSDEDIVALIGGTYSGKTMLADYWLLKKLQQGHKYGIWVEPTNNDIATYLKIDHIEYWWKTLFPGVYNQGKKIYTTNTGQVIQLVSGEAPERMEGRHPGFIVLNEGGMLRRSVWNTAIERAGTTDGQILIPTTPYSKNWLYDVCYGDHRERINPHVIEMKSIDNHHKFTPELIAKMKNRLTPYQFARKYEGKFANPEGLVFQWDDSQVLKVIPNGVKFVRYWGGLDFGYSHPAVALLFAQDSQGGVWVIDECWRTQMTATAFAKEEVLPMLRRNGIKYPRTVTWYCDDSRPDSIVDLQKANLAAVKADKGRVMDGVNAGQELIKEHKCYIVESRCANTYRESFTYEFDERTGEPIKGAGDDSQDAFRYGALNAKNHLHTSTDTSPKVVSRKSIIPEGY